ncbi:MAG: hypothetical protein HDQ99_14710 [Lachnospiraceae bacterium]|nr:hypothetical protein [Lachnospiraceae bacterium]
MDAYSEAVKRFYSVYMPLKRKYNLRSHEHGSIYNDALIEIWEYDGDTKKQRILKIEESNGTDCYNRATDWLKLYEEQKRKGA